VIEALFNGSAAAPRGDAAQADVGASARLGRLAWSTEEDAALVALHAEHGNEWKKVAAELPGRTNHAVKNRWDKLIRRRPALVQEDAARRSANVMAAAEAAAEAKRAAEMGAAGSRAALPKARVGQGVRPAGPGEMALETLQQRGEVVDGRITLRPLPAPGGDGGGGGEVSAEGRGAPRAAGLESSAPAGAGAVEGAVGAGAGAGAAPRAQGGDARAAALLRWVEGVATKKQRELQASAPSPAPRRAPPEVVVQRGMEPRVARWSRPISASCTRASCLFLAHP
jgi:hypothetical protein